MAEYTLLNLKQIDNAAEQFGLGDNLETRFARKPIGLAKFGISYQKLEPDFGCRSGTSTRSRKSST